MALINMTEIIVRQRLEELLKNYDCCKCEQCFYDMMAYALNSLSRSMLILMKVSFIQS